MMKEWQRRVDEMAQGLCWVGYCWHGIGNRSLWLDSATSTATQRVARWRGLWKNHRRGDDVRNYVSRHRRRDYYGGGYSLRK
ncbi:uncharacterized protein [Physcomitrium patens]|uniref:uncharacterized protein isoform X2 n=1 Tax=Physcomitrium patens TaxID=3218 RepID=UPI003CCD77C0